MKSIFVSSAFRDMQSERDCIHTHVLPELNKFAGKYGSEIGFVDLRWGINTEELESESCMRKVLSVCLERIRSCKPYIIVLLGEKYGSVPNRKYIDNALSEIALVDGVRPDIPISDMSITELEIEYGALARENPGRCVFCFRNPLPRDKMTAAELDTYTDPEESESSRRIKDLKAKIVNLYPDKVLRYDAGFENGEVCGLEAFAEGITERIKELMRDELEKNALKTPQQVENGGFRLFAEGKRRSFLARHDLLEQYKAILNADSTKLVILRGEAGAGKSALLCKLAQTLSDGGADVFTFICGNSSGSADVGSLVRLSVWYIEEKLGYTKHFGEEPERNENLPGDNPYYKHDLKSKAPDFNKWREKFTELLFAYSDKFGTKPLILFYDALDRLSESEHLKNYSWLPTVLPGSVRIFATCLDSFALPVFSPYTDGTIYKTLSGVDGSTKRQIINGILIANGKELPQRIVDAIAEKKSSNNPLYISIILERLMMLDSEDFREIAKIGGGMEGIAAHILRLVKEASDELEDISGQLLAEAGERINEALIKTVVSLLAVSRHGLRESDLAAIFEASGKKDEYNPVDLSVFLKYMRPFFAEREDGRIDFTHRTFRDGIIRNLSEEEKQSLNELILRRLKALPYDTKIKSDEIVHHIYLADDTEYFIEYTEHVKYDYPEAAKKAAEAVREISLSDGGRWIKGIITALGADGIKTGLIGFIEFDLYYAFDVMKNEAEIKEDILKSLITYLKSLPSPSDSSLHALSVALDDVGNIKQVWRENAEALALYNEGLEIRKDLMRRNATQEDKINLSLSLNNVAEIHMATGDTEKALALYTESLELRRELVEADATPLNKRSMSIGLNNVAGVHRKNIDIDKALSLYNESLEILRELSVTAGTPESKRDLSVILDDIAGTYACNDDTDKALSFYNESLEIRRDLVKTDTTPLSKADLAICLDNIARICTANGETDKALALFKESLEIFRELAARNETPESKSMLSTSLNNIARIFETKGIVDKALALYSESLGIRRELAKSASMPESKRDLSASLNNVAGIHMFNADTDEALQLYTESLEVLRELAKQNDTPENKGLLSLSLDSIAKIYEGEGDADKALALYTECLEIRRCLAKAEGTRYNKEALSISLCNVAEILKAKGNTNEALELYNADLEISKELIRELPLPRSFCSYAISLFNVGELMAKNIEEINAAKEKIEASYKLFLMLCEFDPCPKYLRCRDEAKEFLDKLK